MKNIGLLRSFAPALSVLFLAVSCVGVPGDKKPGDGNGTSSAQQSTNPPDTMNDTDRNIRGAVFDLMAKLGFNTQQLSISSLNLLSGEDAIRWSANLNCAEGPLGRVVIDESTFRPSMFQTGVRAGEILPRALRVGEDNVQLIAQSLGLTEENGYRKVDWLGQPAGVTGEFRKYSRAGDWEIAVERIVIIAPPSIQAALMINWDGVGELSAPVNVRVSRAEAISKAAGYLGKPEAEAGHAELVQQKSGSTSNAGLGIFWEVVFGRQKCHINADDGSIMEALPRGG